MLEAVALPVAASGSSLTEHQLVTGATLRSTETPAVPAAGASFSDLVILTWCGTCMHAANSMQVCSHCSSVNLLDQQLAPCEVALSAVVFG